MKFSDFFGFSCGICESIWHLGLLNEVQIKFGHVLYCGATRAEMAWLDQQEWPEDGDE